MKNIFRNLMAAAIVVFITNVAFTQSKSFQGTLTYDVSYSGTNLSAAQKAQLPATSVVTVKDCKTKTEVVVGPVTQAAISDGTAKTELVLIDYMGTKAAIKLSTDDVKEGLAKNPMPTVNITKETKVILGFTCKKAILTSKDENGVVTNDTIYFTEQIGCADVNFSTQFKDIPGTVLRYTEFDPQINATATYTIKEIKKSKISDDTFVIPSDYKEMTKEEFKKTFGGGE